MITFALIDKYVIVRTGIGLYFKTQFEQVSIVESQSIAELQITNPDQNPDEVILSISQGSKCKTSA